LRQVDPIHAAVEHLTEKGVRFAPGGIRKGASGHLVAFIHPKGARGAREDGIRYCVKENFGVCSAALT
jgi:hypothetical protein